MIPWREYAVPITIQRKNTFTPLLELMEEVRRQDAEEFTCRLSHPRWFMYRPYRRGKNRCKYCGCKVEGST
jgi:hypothetical protein